MSIGEVSACGVGAVDAMGVRADSQSVLLRARQQRVELLQDRLDEKVGELEAAVDERRRLGTLQAGIAGLLRQGADASGIQQLLRGAGPEGVSRLCGYCTDAEGVHAERLGWAEIKAENWQVFESRCHEDAGKLEQRIDLLKSDLRELGESLGYELKAMQRSVLTGEAATRAIAGDG